jgi:hypothetical protein
MPTELGPVGRRRAVSILVGGLALGSTSGLATAREEGSELSQQLNAVRAVTRDYRDVTTAREHGYEPLLGYFPGMGFHFTDRNPPLGADRNDPPLLVYFTNGSYNPEPGDPHDPERDDDLILGGVEYLVAGDQEADPPDIFADEGSGRELPVTEAEGWHFEADLGITGLHAWVHRGNPAGVFHPTNPTID